MTVFFQSLQLPTCNIQKNPQTLGLANAPGQSHLLEVTGMKSLGLSVVLPVFLFCDTHIDIFKIFKIFLGLVHAS